MPIRNPKRPKLTAQGPMLGLGGKTRKGASKMPRPSRNDRIAALESRMAAVEAKLIGLLGSRGMTAQ